MGRAWGTLNIDGAWVTGMLVTGIGAGVGGKAGGINCGPEIVPGNSTPGGKCDDKL
jgi:hypothetical protein